MSGFPDYVITAVCHDSRKDHIDIVAVRKCDDKINDHSKNGSLMSRDIVVYLIKELGLEFKTVCYQRSTASVTIGAKVICTEDGFLTTTSNETKKDNLGALPRFSVAVTMLR